jgi:hypothetical protein
VILNTCLSVYQGYSLTGIDICANSFLTAGAYAFIGLAWPVNRVVFIFTQKLYKELVRGGTLGEAVRISRNKCKQYGTLECRKSILTKPVGGILFGVAFWMVARSISDTRISDYMKLSAIGIMLLSISNQDASIYLLPYPPFGLPTITFMGLSSYLLFIGIYYSSISISMNAELRKTIESSVEEQFKFVSKIGTSQMENEIQNRVKEMTR